MKKAVLHTVEPDQQWLESPLGRYVLTKEQALFDDALQNIFGFNALQVGMTQLDCLASCRMPYKFAIGDIDESSQHIVAASQQLPILANSIDVILLPHALDFSEDPHHTLTEAERVLVGEGHVIISGFNPISSWGLKRLISYKTSMLSNNRPWNARFLPLLRVKDWLTLLDFEVISVHMTCYNLPINSERWLNRFARKDALKARLWPMMGGVYFVVAKKRVPSMRLIKPSWKAPKLAQQLATTPSQNTPSQKPLKQKIINVDKSEFE